MPPGMMGMPPGMMGMPPGMMGMPPRMMGMPPRMPPSGGQSNELKGLLGALIASRMRPPMETSPMGMPSMPGMFKSLKKGKQMPKKEVCADCGKLKSQCNCDSGSCPECGENEANCSCNDNKSHGRGRKMGKRYGYGSMNKGLSDDAMNVLHQIANSSAGKSVRGALSNMAHNTSNGLHQLGRFISLLNGDSPMGDPKIVLDQLRNMESRRSSKSGPNGSAIGAREGALRTARNEFSSRQAANKDRYEEMKTRSGNTAGGSNYAPRYTQSIKDPENPNISRKQKDIENRNSSAMANTRNASMKDLHEMIMAGINGKNYAAETNARNARENRDFNRANPNNARDSYNARNASMKDMHEMMMAGIYGKNNVADHSYQNARDARDFYNAKSGQGSGLTTSRSSSANKRMSKSIASMERGGVRHMVGGYSTSRSGSMSKRARPANNTNTTRNKYGY